MHNNSPSQENRIIAFHQGQADMYGEFRIKVLFPSGLKGEYKFSEEVTVGRGSSAGIILKDEWLSRLHCRIFVDGHDIYVEDLDSTNGIVVNGVLIKRIKLNKGDEIELGQIIMVVEPCLESVVESKIQEEVHEVTIVSGVLDKESFIDVFGDAVLHNENGNFGSSLLCIKIDHLTELSNLYDDVLKEFLMLELSRYLNQEKLSDEIVGRYDDFFLYYLSDIDQDKASAFAENICQAIKKRRFMLNHEQIQCTISIGIAHRSPGEVVDAEEIVKISQLACIQAQEDGGNAVVEQSCYS